LTTNGPISISFEDPEFELDITHRSRSPTYDEEPEKPLRFIEPRPVYQPASSFDEDSALPSLLAKLQHTKYKRLLKEEVRLSPATLSIMTEAHKVLSEETYRLGMAAAELFRRCDRLQIELRSQINKANEVAKRIESQTGEDFDDGPSESSNEIMERRIQVARENQKAITARFENMRKRITKNTNRELSDKERAWADEIVSLENKVLGAADVHAASSNKKNLEPWQRYEEVKHLKAELLEQIQMMAQDDEGKVEKGIKVPSEIRKAKVAQIMGLLERETALVEGAKLRLEKLNLG